MKFASYSSYKQSKIPELGSIPAHWDENRAKNYFYEIDERSVTGDEEMLSVSHITGITPRSQKNVTMFKAESNIGQKICSNGDIVINTMWAWMAALGVSRYYGIVSPSYGVYRKYSVDSYNNDYLDNLLRNYIYKTEYTRRSTGIRSSRLRLYPDKFLSMAIICPPISEQNQITRFIRYYNYKINKYLTAKRKQISLLKEQKQVIINNAVTKGINPNTKMKSSGIKWLGNIPESWELIRLKSIVHSRKIGSWGSEPANKDYNCICLRVADFDFDKGIFKERKIDEFTIRNYTDVQIKHLKLLKGDLCIEKSGGGDASPVGRCVLFKEDFLAVFSNFIEKLCINTSICRNKFAEFIFQSLYYNKINNLYIKQTTGIQNLDLDCFLSQTYIPIQNIEEQDKIIKFIEIQIEKINFKIESINKQVNLVQEYRSRLIFDAVTGKIDVRNIDIPDITEEELSFEMDSPEISDEEMNYEEEE